MDQRLVEAALEYHRKPTPGKISVTPTKGLTNQRDLSLAYSPGVAAACMAIHGDPSEAASLTSRANLVGVVTNGTAVLGLGNIGPLAAKPVMEGKGVLFKKFAGIDVFDIELDEKDPARLIEIIAALEPTLGGVNLEDIKAPECFQIEKALRERMKIPVFHDDQHGTAIISAAAVLNGLKVVGKDIGSVRLVSSGAGAAAIACLDLMVHLGLRREHIVVVDSRGVIYRGRESAMEPNKARYARDTPLRTLADAVRDADIFLGCSSAGVLKPEMVKTMAPRPIILALANPEPEIRPELARAARPDCMIATGRSDYPNQVNNVLCFPFIFRGALDVGATGIDEAMKLACVSAIAELARIEQAEIPGGFVAEERSFGPDYIIPSPFDPRLLARIAPAVAKAAMDSGIATRPIADLDAYREKLAGSPYRTGLIMKPVFGAARVAQAKRVVYAEGEDERVLRATRTVLDEGLARPILIGRPSVIEMRIERLGLKLKPGSDVEVVNPESDDRYKEVWERYRALMGRKGVTPDVARSRTRRHSTLIGAMLMDRGEADALICGVAGATSRHLAHIADVIGLAPGAPLFATMNLLMLASGTLFIADTYVNEDPDARQVAAIAMLAAEQVRRFGIEPRVALLSHSTFGTAPSRSATKMAQALAILRELAPTLEVDGEMQGDAALSRAVRERALPETTLEGEANLLVMPNLDAANIAFTLLKITGGEGVTVGPILLGAARPVHIMTPDATVRRLVNATAFAVAEAQGQGPGPARVQLQR
ncbi:MAG: NADP-dependent malic enzyme [Lautropia sp.]